MEDDIDGKDEFIALVAERARFTKKDVRIILDTIIEILTETARARKRITVRGLGELYVQELQPRKSSKLFGSRILPATTRVIFRLASTIQNAAKRKDASE